MRRMVRTAMTVVACGAITGGTLIGGAPASAAPADWPAISAAQRTAEPFPHLYSKVRPVPTVDEDGKLNPWNNVVWDHATILTHSQTVAVRDSGALPVITGTRIPPYSGLAGVALNMLATPASKAIIAGGGCLALYWSDQPFTGPDGRRVQVQVQVLGRSFCRR